MERLIKLSDEYHCSGVNYKKIKWGSEVEHGVSSDNPRLCSHTVIHAYRDTNAALIMNPSHSAFVRPVIWQAMGKVVVSDALKVGCSSLRTFQIISLPYWWTQFEYRFKVTQEVLVKSAEAMVRYLGANAVDKLDIKLVKKLENIIDVTITVIRNKRNKTAIKTLNQLERSLDNFVWRNKWGISCKHIIDIPRGIERTREYITAYTTNSTRQLAHNATYWGRVASCAIIYFAAAFPEIDLPLIAGEAVMEHCGVQWNT